MKLEELKFEITNFKKTVVVYKKLLENSADFMGNADFDDEKISETRSKLVKKYAALEKYIKIIGQNPQMHDGVWATLYSVYDNGLSSDILVRVMPSIEGILTDLDYISGKLESFGQKDFEDIFQNKKAKTSKVVKGQESGLVNYWNYINPFWLIWRFLILLWKYKIVSFFAAITASLVAGYILWRLGW